jgi:hypothetical protein
MPKPIGLPTCSVPFWLGGVHPLANYQSNPELPDFADVVIIGAGLTGASAAYHLADAARERRLGVLVLDRGDPACEARGRNGSFERIPENSVGTYEGLARERPLFLKRRYAGLAKEILQAESERQASLVLGLSLGNRDRFKAIIRRENINWDYCPRGWLYLAQHRARRSRESAMKSCLRPTMGSRSRSGRGGEFAASRPPNGLSRPVHTRRRHLPSVWPVPFRVLAEEYGLAGDLAAVFAEVQELLNEVRAQRTER